MQIEGGAAELSWSLRDSCGGNANCGDSGVDITRIKLCWYPLDQDDGTPGQCPNFQDFACSKSTGVTSFDIAPGSTALFIEPIFGSGAQSYQVPPPIVRDVEEGRVVTLNSLLVVVNTGTCGSR